MSEELKSTVLKIEIRHDQAAGLVRATFVGFGETREVGSLADWLVEAAPEAFEDWKRVLRDAFITSLEAAGICHGGFSEVPLDSLN